MTGEQTSSGQIFENIELLAKDSLFVFIETTIDIENELKKAINYERNRQLNQYSKIYYNKIKKNLDFNG